MSGGEVYENLVYTVIKSVVPAPEGLEVLPKSSTSSSVGVDLPLVYLGDPLSVEIKMDGAQMSGTSLRYNRETHEFSIVKAVDDSAVLIEAARTQTDALDAYIDALKKEYPVEFHSSVNGFPLRATTDARTNLKRLGLQRVVEKRFKHPIDFLKRFHNSKGVHYIQIQNKGFFHLGTNPFNFPIPELDGEFQIEFRIGYAGTKVAVPTPAEAPPEAPAEAPPAEPPPPAPAIAEKKAPVRRKKIVAPPAGAEAPPPPPEIVHFFSKEPENKEFSNFYDTKFTLDGVNYSSAEHAYQAIKAKTFGDEEHFKKIVKAKSAQSAKSFGKKVTGYNEELWAAKKDDAMKSVLRAKFTQNLDIRKKLMDTGEKVLANSDSRDKYWGTGTSASTTMAKDPSKWKGENKLGKFIMELRAELKAEA
jgi:ribA/ribD-fused uncharacterized protein